MKNFVILLFVFVFLTSCSCGGNATVVFAEVGFPINRHIGLTEKMILRKYGLPESSMVTSIISQPIGMRDVVYDFVRQNGGKVKHIIITTQDGQWEFYLISIFGYFVCVFDLFTPEGVVF
jgi:hypothetical protein